MPPKGGRKRKVSGAYADGLDAESPLLPTRETWPGWVEMESEPAFFNVMLKEMGVRDVKVQEVYGLDDDMLAILPHPVHALIFLFRYRTADQADQESGTGHDHIWFANQLPEFACATVALLNIVNNIPGLTMGQELRQFKDFTTGMNPLLRGDAIDSFDFVRRIHNSFARENDLLAADMHSKIKFDKAKKKEATAKARVTREARKTLRTLPAKPSARHPPNSRRSSARQAHPSSRLSVTPPPLPPAFKEFPSQPNNIISSPLSSLEDSDFLECSNSQLNDENVPVRRSTRTPKPRRIPDTGKDTEDEIEEESGFHFIAYMPIGDHVWKLDGLNRSPQDLGTFEPKSDQNGNEMADWVRLAQPAIAGRMAQFEGADIQFNLMAVVRDPAIKDRDELVKNVKALQIIDAKLKDIAEDWVELEGTETKKEVITSTSPELGIDEPDVESATLCDSVRRDIEKEEDLLRLIELRKGIISQQSGLRGGVRDALVGSKEDEERARHRRHDYRSFVRGWLGALAEDELLADLVDE